MKVIKGGHKPSGKTRAEVVEEARIYALDLKALGVGAIEMRRKIEKKFKKYNLKLV